eukprot:Pgem_evm1s7538
MWQAKTEKRKQHKLIDDFEMELKRVKENIHDFKRTIKLEKCKLLSLGIVDSILSVLGLDERSRLQIKIKNSEERCLNLEKELTNLETKRDFQIKEQLIHVRIVEKVEREFFTIKAKFNAHKKKVKEKENEINIWECEKKNLEEKLLEALEKVLHLKQEHQLIENIANSYSGFILKLSEYQTRGGNVGSA